MQLESNSNKGAEAPGLQENGFSEILSEKENLNKTPSVFNLARAESQQLATKDSLPKLELYSDSQANAARVEDRFSKGQRDRDFYKFLDTFDLNSDKFATSYKNSGSTIGLKVLEGKTAVGKWSPKNGTSDPEAQEVSHRLAQFLNVSDLVTPSAYYDLTGNALEKFRQIVQKSEEKDERRSQNRENILRMLAENPSSLQGVITPWIPTITEVKGLTRDTDIYGSFNTEHPIAKLLQADGPMPGDSELTLQTGKGALAAPEKQLAKELSQIMVIDVLCGQYDRFNGANIEATYDEKSGLHFLARDNGGASMNSEISSKEYFNILSRFDQAQIKKVEELLSELDGPNAKSLVSELHLQSDPKFLKDRATALLEHVNKMRQTYGDEKVFFS